MLWVLMSMTKMYVYEITMNNLSCDYEMMTTNQHQYGLIRATKIRMLSILSILRNDLLLNPKQYVKLVYEKTTTNQHRYESNRATKIRLLSILSILKNDLLLILKQYLMLTNVYGMITTNQ